MVQASTTLGSGAARHGVAGVEACRPPGACADCLRASALGAELSDAQVSRLRDLVGVHPLKAGDVLIREGDYDDRLYALAQGELEIRRNDEAGGTILLKRLKPGALTGELAFIEGLERTATVGATADSCVISLRRDRLESLLEVDPSLVYRVMRAVIRSAHQTVGNLDTTYADFVRYVTR